MWFVFACVLSSSAPSCADQMISTVGYQSEEFCRGAVNTVTEPGRRNVRCEFVLTRGGQAQGGASDAAPSP
jgi:hypothetical protein